MHRDSQSEKHYHNSERYLEQTSDGYSINPHTGIYEPASHKETSEVTQNRRIKLEEKSTSDSQARETGSDRFDLFFSSLQPLGRWYGRIDIFPHSGSVVLDSWPFAQKQWRENAQYYRSKVLDPPTSPTNRSNNLGEAMAQSKRQFIQEQRPYLWREDEDKVPPRVWIEPPGAGTNAGKLAVDLSISNFGKSPALHVGSYSYVSAEMPNVEDDVHWEAFPKIHEGIYPPGGGFSKTGHSDKVVSSSILRAVPSGPGEVSPFTIHTLIKYTDYSGTPYSSEICVVWQRNLVWKKCKRHNEMK